MTVFPLFILALSTADPPTLVALLATIVGVPIGLIIFALRGLREQISAARNDFDRRIDHTQCDFQRIETRMTAAEREFATKEDWLRESMLARRGIERLTESVARLEAGPGSGKPSSHPVVLHNSRRNELDGAFGGTD